MYKTTHRSNRGLSEVFVFEGIAEMVEEAGKARFTNHRPYTPDLNRPNFYGREFHEWEDVIAAATSRWDEGIEIIEDMIRQVSDADMPRPVSRRRVGRWSEDDGQEIDIDRLRSGQPFWRASTRKNVAGPATITICVNVAGNSDKDSGLLLWRGAAAVVLTKILEEAGYRVELWACRSSDNTFKCGANMLTATKIKGPMDPLDIGAAATSVSGWFFRSVGLHVTNCSRRIPKSNLGTAVHIGSDNRLDAAVTAEQRVIVDGVWNKEEAVSAIRCKLAELKLDGQTAR